MRRTALILALCTPLSAWSGEAVVEAAKLTASGTAWRVDVTLRHGDTGWDHYADGWEVVDADGARLGYRELLHPHVNEQPFTRSLSGVVIPDGTAVVYIRAHDSVHGWSDQLFKITLP